MAGALAVRDNLLFAGRAGAGGSILVFDLSRRRLAVRIELPDARTEVAGLAVDAASNLYVADPAANAVRRQTVFGREVGRFGSAGPAGDRRGFLDAPRACALDSDENLYVACGREPLVHGVQKFAPDGRCVGSLRCFGEPGERFGAPRGVAVVGDRLFVADTRGGCVQVFTTAGTFVAMFGTSTQAGEISMPCALAARPGGGLFVAQVGDEPCVKAFSGGGEIDRVWVEGGSGEGETEEPVGLACGVRGDLFLLDRGGACLRRFGPGGALEEVLFEEERLPA